MTLFLHSIDNKPYKGYRWREVDITPNTVLSLLSTLSESAFLLAVSAALGQLKWIAFRRHAQRLIRLQQFDDATRGPRGALALIWHIRARDLLACMGALVTAIALATDPFTRQILAFPMVTAEAHNMSARINTAQSLDWGYVWARDNGTPGKLDQSRTIFSRPLGYF